MSKAKKNIKYRLGLDIGTSSLGWSVLELDKDNKPFRIEKAGSRIFSEGREAKTLSTLKATRRQARSARRRHDRYKQRRLFLITELEKAKLFPEDEQEKKRLQELDPYKLRAEALNKKMTPHEIGRALFHLNQRRGFKSSRKDKSEEVTGGKLKKGMLKTLEEMKLKKAGLSKEEYKELSREEKKDARIKEFIETEEAMKNLAKSSSLSLGSYLYERSEEGLPVRVRPSAGDDLYDFYPTRELLEDEFNKIWEAQKKHHPRLLTDQLRERIHSIIFTQRRLKPQTVGKCTYLPKEDRAFKSMPSFQHYRIYQIVNNLEWRTSLKSVKLIDFPEARDAVIELFNNPGTKKGNVTFGKIRKCLKEMETGIGESKLNFEDEYPTGLMGNITSNLMSQEHLVGEEWHSWDLNKQDQFIAALLDDKKEDKEVVGLLVDKYGLSQQSATACIEDSIYLEDGTARLSLKAARLLMAKMRDDYCIQPDAVKEVAESTKGFENPVTRRGEGEVLPQLPYYGKAFQDGRHIIPGDRLEADEGDDLKYYGGVTNPTVHIALNQIRHVVNELINLYGHPASISIELARELPAGEMGRRKIIREQNENRAKNEELDEELEKLGQRATPQNRMRLRLWEELDEDDPNGRCCPFSGEKIGISDLFSDKFEIEHLLPFSRSLDDSRSNKVITSRRANRDKKKRSPFEAFGDSPKDYNWEEIFKRAEKLPRPKRWRFHEDAWEKWEKDEDNFLMRHLTDTQYIGRLTKEYLENICPYNKIDVLTGRLTALLRGHWGLNKILQTKENPEKKNRDDHRHHAVDAITIAMINRSMLQKVSTEANRGEELEVESLFPKNKNGKSAIDPWDGFREDAKKSVNQIIVSHKAGYNKLNRQATDGALHEETAYGIISGPDEKSGKYKVVVRKDVLGLDNKTKLEKIRDPRLKKEFLKAHKADAKNGVVKLAEKLGIKKLRCIEEMNIIPIKDRSGNPYKGYRGGNNWGMEIYEYPEGHEEAGKWEWEIISRYEVSQKDFQPGVGKRPHPTARLIMRLHINDCVEIQPENEKKIMRVQKLSLGQIYLAEHNEANVDKRNRDDNENFKYTVTQSLKALQALNPRKVHISPTGRLNYEKR